jgi:hypothetical protein
MLQDTATIVRCKRHVSQWATLAAELELVIVDSQQLFPASKPHPCCPECAGKLINNGMAQNAKIYKGIDKTQLVVTRQWHCSNQGALHMRGSSDQLQHQHPAQCADLLLLQAKTMGKEPGQRWTQSWSAALQTSWCNSSCAHSWGTPAPVQDLTALWQMQWCAWQAVA